MKEFLEPKLTVLAFTVEDIITVSGGGGGLTEEEDGGVVLPSDKLT